MPVLKNARHERFAQEYAKGCSAAEAFRRAGYSAKTVQANATRMMGMDGVAQRVAELQGTVLQRHDITVDGLIAQFEEIRTLAMKGKKPQLQVAANAVTAIAKLAGLWIERSANVNRNISGELDPSKMSDAEIWQHLFKLAERGEMSRADVEEHKARMEEIDRKYPPISDRRNGGNGSGGKH